MENLNAEQVKKALRGHIGVVDMRCEECHYNQVNGSETCIALLITDALALINSQEQRIKELTQANEQLSESYDQLEKTKDELLLERSRLTEENERLKAQKYYIHSDDRIEMIPTVESVRADTVRKMQERLKECFNNEIKHMSIYTEGQVLFAVDQIAKEMLECK